MSGILRNTLHLVGTAKYATNNSTKYLRSMTLTASRFNHSAPNYFNRRESVTTQGPLTNFWTTIRTTRKLFSTYNYDRITTSSIGDFEVSLSNVNVKVMSDKNIENLVLLPTFSTELNKKSIKPESNKNSDIERSFNVGVCDLLLHGAELKLKLIDSGKAFILKHEIHVEAFQKSSKPVKGGYKRIAPKLDDRFICSNAKIISKVKGLEPKEQKFKVAYNLLSNKFVGCGSESPEENQDKITDRPNSVGRMKLQFPMAVLLEGAPHKIKIIDSDDCFTIYHTVAIEAMINPVDTEQINLLKPFKPVNILRVELSSGDIMIKTAESAKQTAIFSQEVGIVIDVGSQIPSILVSPSVETLLFE